MCIVRVRKGGALMGGQSALPWPGRSRYSALAAGRPQGVCERRRHRCRGAGAGAAAFVPRPLPAPAAGGRPPARRPPTIARRVGSRAVPETFPSRLRRRRQRPSPGRGRALGRGRRRRRGSTGPGKGARRGCAPAGPRGRLGPGPGGATEPWGRRPAPRPRSGTGTTWTAASPATASASPSACGSAPPPAGSPPTRCNGDWDRAARGRGPGLRRGARGDASRQLPPGNLEGRGHKGGR